MPKGAHPGLDPDAASTSEDVGPWGDTSDALDVSAEEDSDEEPDSAVEEDLAKRRRGRGGGHGLSSTEGRAMPGP